MHARHGGRTLQEKDFCAGLSAKDVVAAGKGLPSSGWTCSSPACGAKGNFPNRRLCRGCGKATGPAAWITAQQRAAALKASSGSESPWSPKGAKARAEASEPKQLQELRKELAQAQKENQQLKAAGSAAAVQTAQPSKSDEVDDDPAEDALSKQVAYLQRLYDQCVAAKDTDLAPTIKDKLERAQKEWRATWPADRVRTRHVRRLESAKEKLTKCEVSAVAAGQKVEDCESELAQAKLEKEAAHARLGAATEEAAKIEEELAAFAVTQAEQAADETPNVAELPGQISGDQLIALLEQAMQQQPEQANKIAATLRINFRGAAAARAGAGAGASAAADADAVMADAAEPAGADESLERSEQQKRAAEQAAELAELRKQVADIRGLGLAVDDGVCATKLQALTAVLDRDSSKRQKRG